MVGLASMDVRHHHHAGGAARESKFRLAYESMRELKGDESLARWAAKNPSIDTSMSHLNVSMVNDGQGGFRPASDVKEVVQYRDERVAKVFRKLGDKTYTDSTMVFHYPKHLCDESSFTDADGNTHVRHYAKDPAEMHRYFQECNKYLATIIGGHDAIHAYAINMDETTPHMHVMADPFEDDAKHPGKLRAAGAKFWFQDRTGPSGKQKVAAYHEGFKKHLRAAGFEVEPEVTERSKQRLSLPEYKAAMDDLAHMQSQADGIRGEKSRVDDERMKLLPRKHAVLERKEAELAEQDHELIRRSSRLDERETAVCERETAVADTEAQQQQKASQIVAQAQQQAQVRARRILEDAEAEAQQIREAAALSAQQASQIVREAVPAVLEGYFRKNPKVAEHFERHVRVRWSERDAVAKVTGKQDVDDPRNRGRFTKTHLQRSEELLRQPKTARPAQHHAPEAGLEL